LSKTCVKDYTALLLKIDERAKCVRYIHMLSLFANIYS